MQARWDIGDAVRVVRNVRNDGTYPGAGTGDLLIRRGSVGTVVDIGTFLQDQIIYSVHFLEGDRIVGCREEELIGAAEAWLPSAYEARERVAARKILALGGDARVPRGAVGEVLRVMRDGAAVVYHVHFECLPGRTLAVPEAALASLAEARGA
ncbi:MAG: nitrogen fixation protein NifZ [Rhodocyclales bacterium GWA2_65_20]|nr:MAG: nitrogen fixation protein NifZ [Rhodocyclales bacterium GWA2_65_20]